MKGNHTMEEEFNVDQFLDALEELEEYGRGGGGLFGRFMFQVAFFIYSGDVDADEKLYPFVVTDQDDREKARESALDTLGENNIEASSSIGPHISYVITFYKDGAKGKTGERAANWQGDRVFAVPIWSPAAKEVIKPALRELGIAPGEYWGRITFKPDPSGRTDTDLEGKERPALVAYPAEVFASEADAEEAAGKVGDGKEAEGAIAEIPPKVVKRLVAAYNKEREGGANRLDAAETVAEEWGYSIDEILAVV